MELEPEAGGGRVVSLSSASPAADLGRGDLGPSADATVSRRHVALRLVGDGEPRVAFEVVGMNPVVVRPSVGEEKAYRRGEAGELREGNGLSLSLKAPSFWKVRRKGGEAEVEVDTAVLDAVERREKRTRERKEKEREKRAVEEAMEEVAEEEEMVADGNEELDEELEDLKIDMENIDPVHEFGFLSMGHEFDNYPKGRIRAPKDWNWFLEETKKGSDDEDDDEVNNMGRKSRGGGGVNKKKKKKGEDEDEEWTDVSEDEKDSLQRGPSVKRPKKYVTRSKAVKKPRKESSKTENEDTADEDEDDGIDEEDEEDETLGGFIVQEEDDPMDELSEEEEDEFDDEEEDD